MVAELVLLTGLVKSLSGQNIKKKLTNDSLSPQKDHLLALVIASWLKKMVNEQNAF